MNRPDGIREFLLKRGPQKVRITFTNGSQRDACLLVAVLDDGLAYEKLCGKWAVVPYTAIQIISEG